MNSARSITTTRLTLLENGYLPIPCEGKIPAPKEWQKRTDTNPEEIKLWEKVFPHARNTGILTQLTPALDVDILNPEAAQAVEDLPRDRLDGHVLVRFGQPPKRAKLHGVGRPSNLSRRSAGAAQ